MPGPDSEGVSGNKMELFLNMMLRSPSDSVAGTVAGSLRFVGSAAASGLAPSSVTEIAYKLPPWVADII